MPLIQPFENHADRYEEWFERNRFVYLSELEAVRRLLPSGFGLEIGSGSARFSIPLGVDVGVDPSMRMNGIAIERGLSVVCGAAEALPFKEESFDFALMVTTVCFVDDVELSFIEAYRTLRPGGSLIVGLVDRRSRLGALYEKKRGKSLFYASARFYTTEEIVSAMNSAGFGGFSYAQTIFQDLDEIESIEPVFEGYGDGSFVVVRGVKGVEK